MLAIGHPGGSYLRAAGGPDRSSLRSDGAASLAAPPRHASRYEPRSRPGGGGHPPPRVPLDERTDKGPTDRPNYRQATAPWRHTSMPALQAGEEPQLAPYLQARRSRLPGRHGMVGRARGRYPYLSLDPPVRGEPGAVEPHALAGRLDGHLAQQQLEPAPAGRHVPARPSGLPACPCPGKVQQLPQLGDGGELGRGDPDALLQLDLARVGLGRAEPGG